MTDEPFVVTFFADYTATTNRREALTLKELAGRIAITSGPAKQQLPWLKCALFGDVRTERGSLRHDANILAISGVEVDYDLEKITVESAIEILEKAGIEAIVYTSPSHMRDGHGPRWRVLCPLSKEYPPQHRERLVCRLAGLFRDGNVTVLAVESFSRSQAYYFGAVDHNPEHRVKLIRGEKLDQLDELDLIALGKPATKSAGRPGNTGGPADEAALIEQIVTGGSYHTAAVRLLGTLARHGVPMMEAERRLREAFDAALLRDQRWRDRVAEIPRLLDDIWGREARQADARTAKADAGLAELEARAAPAIEGGVDPGRERISLADFFAYLPGHKYLFVPTRELWPAASVNTRLPSIPIAGSDDKIPPSVWLDQNKPIEQMVWAPGKPMTILDRVLSDGGWIEHEGVTCFNLYKPPLLKKGNATKAAHWIAHIETVYPTDTSHIIRWLAHRVQRPEDKLNHALVLGGEQGIGEDSLLEPVKRAVGPWNFAEPSPLQMMGRFNSFAKSVILRISEVRDLGDTDRYAFYEHLKIYTASPPDVLRVDEKNLREYNILNCCGVVITTNHLTDGVYLPADDRRHYVAWSLLTKDDFPEDYWIELWRFYDNGGDRHVAAYLAELDLKAFNPKAPPPKTEAFWTIVNAGRAPEDAELATVLDLLGNPDAVTLRLLAATAEETTSVDDGFVEWLRDRKNRRIILYRLEACGYVPVRNPDAREDKLWKIGSRRVAIYARSTLAFFEQIKAARELTATRSSSV